MIGLAKAILTICFTESAAELPLEERKIYAARAINDLMNDAPRGL